ncbi:MAG: LptF/LptG family permease, partial [Candidatus Sericytochromatia bacterium]
GFWLQEYVVPWANRQTVEILKNMMSREPIQAIKEKTFLNLDRRYFYVHEIDRNINLLKQLYILDQTRTDLPQVIAAQRATREQTKWVLRNGILHKLEPGGWIDHEIRFRRMEIEMEFKPPMVFSDAPDVRSLASGDAAKLIEQKKAQGQDVRQDLMDLYTKYSLPLATFFTILLAAPIGIMFSKMGNYFGVAISIALVFIWYVTYSIFTSLGKAGTVTPLLAAWIQNIAFGSVGVLLLLQLSGVNFARWLFLPFRVLAAPFVLLVRRLRRPKKA